MNKNITKLLSVMLVAVMIVMMIPFAASAASDAKQITSLDQLTTGKYVIATSATNIAMAKLDGTWVTAESVTPENGKLTGVADDAVWTVTVVSSGSVKLTDCNNVSIAPKGGNNNGISNSDYTWNVTCTDGKFTFNGVGSDTVSLASNKGSSGQFRAYKTSTISGNPEGYPSEFYVYKVTGSSAGGAAEAPTYVSVTEARAASAATTVYTSGVIVFIDGKNVVITDGTSGINLYLSAADSSLKVGDMVKASGKRGAYSGLEQLSSASIVEVVSSNNTINYKETTIATILADYEGANVLESTPVLLKGVTVGAVDGNYVPVTDAAGNTIKIYKCPELSGIAAGDKADIKCVVSDFNGYQLRVASASDVVKASAEEVTTAPAVTTEAPAVTTEAPVVTTAAPAVTTAPETTAAPTTAPETSDASFVIIAMAALAGIAVAFVVSKKKARA